MGFLRFAPTLALLLLAYLALLPAPTASAQYETQLVTLIDKTPIVLEAPFPFVEVSRNLPDIFAQRRVNIGAANRLIAWFVPRLTLKDLLDDKNERYRSLQVQVQRDTELVRYDPADLKKTRDQLIRETPGLARINLSDVDSLFAILDLTQFQKRTGAQKILGLATLGEDSYTLCIATSAEGVDLRGARQIEASVSCVTHVLVKDKILILTVTGPEVSATELDNAMRTTAKWIALLRDANPPLKK